MGRRYRRYRYAVATGALGIVIVKRRNFLTSVTGRVTDDLCRLAHVPDGGNVVDWMTKWVKWEKLRSSLEYLTGERSRLLHATGAHALAAYHALVAHVRGWT